MDVSTKKVLTRLITNTHTHPESDQSGDIEEKWGDASIDYKGYTKYDESEVIADVSISEKDKIAIRHTHLYLPNDIEDEIKEIQEYYMENKIGPYEFPFDGTVPGSDVILPIPDASIDSLAEGPGADIVVPIPDASIDSLRD